MNIINSIKLPFQWIANNILLRQPAKKLVGHSLLLWVMCASASPTGHQVAAGSASVTQNGSLTQIQQSTQKAIINWQTFNVAQGEHVQFIQPSASSITLNRVNPANGTSNILGNLTANGNVWIINPAGVLFGATAQVDVAGLLATTLNISDSNFMSGNYHFVQSPDWSGAIINEGQIRAADSGLVALVAPGVENRGVINARLGKVALASGTEFTLDMYGDQLINFSLGSEITKAGVDGEGNTLKNAVSNSGSIFADGGKVMLSAKAAKDVVDNVINMSGYVQARSVAQRNGEIVLMGGDKGVVRVAGKLDASGKGAGQKGGKVHVLGEKVGLFANTEIDATGDAGGGEVLVGGDTRGQGTVPTATATYVDPDAIINASALNQGNGGKVILWGDNSLATYGQILAKGGAVSGDGGFIETSSKGFLDIGAVAPNVSAINGNAGTWLIDPTNLTISASSDANVTSSNPFKPTGTLNATLNIETLRNALLLGNVTIETVGSAGAGTGVITFSPGDITWTSASIGSDARILTLNSAAGIVFNNSLIITDGAHLALNLNANTIIAGGTFTLAPTKTITTNGDDISFKARDLALGVNSTLNAGTASINIDAGSNSFNLGGASNGLSNLELTGVTAANLSVSSSFISLSPTNLPNISNNLIINADVISITNFQSGNPTGGPLNVILNAPSSFGSGITFAGATTTYFKNLTVNSQNSITVSQKIQASGNVNLSSQNSVAINNDVTANSGSITLTADNGINLAANLSALSNINLNSTLGEINQTAGVLNGFSLNINANNNVNLTQNNTMQQLTGMMNGSALSNLNYTSANGLLIGDLLVNGNITINSLNDTVAINNDVSTAAGSNGNINITTSNGFISLTSGKSLTADGSGDISLQNTGGGKNIAINGNVTSATGTINLETDASVFINTGFQVQTNGDINVRASEVSLEGGGTPDFINLMSGGTLKISSNGALEVNPTFSFGGLVITPTTLSRLAADHLILEATNDQDLSVENFNFSNIADLITLRTQGIGDIYFLSFLSTPSIFKTLNIESGGTIQIYNELQTTEGALTATAGGDISLGNAIYGAGGVDLTANGLISIDWYSGLSTNNADINIHSPLTGQYNLTVNAGTGTTNFYGAVGNVSSPLSDSGVALTLNSTGNTIFHNTVTTNGAISAQGSVTFNDAVNLQTALGSPTASIFNGNVTIGANSFTAVDGVTFAGNLTVTNPTLTINTTNNNFTANSILGANTADLTINTGLGDILINGDNTLHSLAMTANHAFITTTNNSNLTLGNTTLTGNLSINSAGDIGQLNVGNLNVTGTTALTAASGNINLNQANHFGDTLTISQANNASIASNGNLKLGLTNITGIYNVSATGSITNSSDAFHVNEFNATAVDGINIAGDTQINKFSATNSGSGDINLANSTADLTLGEINQVGTGAITISNVGNLTINDLIAHTGTGNINLTTSGGSNNITVANNVTAASGTINITTDRNLNVNNGYYIDTGGDLNLNSVNFSLGGGSTANFKNLRSNGTLTYTSPGSIGINYPFFVTTAISDSTLNAIQANNLVLKSGNNSQFNINFLDANLFSDIANHVTIESQGSGDVILFGQNPIFKSATIIGGGGITFGTSGITTTQGDLVMNAGGYGIDATGITSAGKVTLNSSSGVKVGEVQSADKITITAQNLNLSRPAYLTTSNNADIEINADVNGIYELAINAGAGTTTINGSIGNDTPIGSISLEALIINSTGSTIFNGSINTNGAMIAQGSVTFNDDVYLGPSLSSSRSIFNHDVIFNNNNFTAVDGADFGSSTNTSHTVTVSNINLNTTNSALAFYSNVVGSNLIFNTGSADVILTNSANQIDALAFTSANNATIRNSQALSLGNSSLSGNLDIQTTGNIDQSGAINVAGNTNLAAGSSHDINLNNIDNNFTGTIAVNNTNNVTIHDSSDLNIGQTGILGKYTASSDGVIANSNTLLANELDATAVGGITLTSGVLLNAFSAHNSGSGHIELNNNAANLALNGITQLANNGNINIYNTNGSIVVNNAVTATGAGEINMTAFGIGTGILFKDNATSGTGTLNLLADGAIEIESGKTVSTNGLININAPDIQLGGGGINLNSGSGNINIISHGSIYLGPNSVSGMHLTNDELASIAAADLTLNSGNNATVYIDSVANTAFANIDNLTINSLLNGEVTFEGGASSFKNLDVYAAKGIYLGTDLNSDSHINLSAGNEGIILKNTVNLTANGVVNFDGRVNGDSTGANLSVTTASADGVNFLDEVGDLTPVGDSSGLDYALKINAPHVRFDSSLSTQGAIYISDAATFKNSVNIGNSSLPLSSAILGDIIFDSSNPNFHAARGIVFGSNSDNTMTFVNNTYNFTTNENNLNFKSKILGNPTLSVNTGTAGDVIFNNPDNVLAGINVGNVGSLDVATAGDFNLIASDVSDVSYIYGLLNIAAGGAVNISGRLPIVGNLTITANGPINQTQTSRLFANGTSYFNTGINNDITLIGNNAFIGAVDMNGRNIQLNNFQINPGQSLILGATNVAGNLNITATGDIIQSDILNVVGNSQFEAGNNITLSNTNNSFTGTVSINAQNAELHNDKALILGESNVVQTLNVTANGSISDEGTIQANSLIAQAEGGIVLNQGHALNQFTATNSGFGNIELVNTGNLSLSLNQLSANGSIIITNTGDLTSINNTTINDGNLNLTSINGSLNVLNNLTTLNNGTINLTASGGTGNILVNGNINSSGNLTVDAAGGLTVANGNTLATNNQSITITANDLTLNGGGININSGSGNLRINALSSIGLGSSTGNTMQITGAELQSINANNLILAAGNNSSIIANGVAASNFANIASINLSATNGNGSIQFNGAPSSFKNLTVNANNGVTVNQAISTSIGGININADADGIGAGTLALNAGINSAADINLSAQSGGINLGASVSLIANNAGININDTLTGNHDLTVNAGSGTTQFNADVNNVGSGVGYAINLASTGLTEFQGLLNTNSGITTNGAVNFYKDVNLGAGDTQSVFHNDITLNNLNFSAQGGAQFGDNDTHYIYLAGGPVNITANNQNLIFNSRIENAQALTIDAGNGIVTLAGNIGDANPLASLTTKGTGKVLLGANITTSGNTLTFENPVELIDDVTLTDLGTSGIFFKNTLDGSHNLNLHTPNGDIYFEADVGANTKLNQLSVVNANDVIGYATVLANAYQQTAGNGLTNFAQLTTNSNININTYLINGSYEGNDITLNGLNGISAQVVTSHLTLGGLNGGEVTGIVNGFGGDKAAMMTMLAPSAMGDFYVNGCLVPGTFCNINPLPPVPPVINSDVAIDVVTAAEKENDEEDHKAKVCTYDEGKPVDAENCVSIKVEDQLV